MTNFYFKEFVESDDVSSLNLIVEEKNGRQYIIIVDPIARQFIGYFKIKPRRLVLAVLL